MRNVRNGWKDDIGCGLSKLIVTNDDAPDPTALGPRAAMPLPVPIPALDGTTLEHRARYN